MKRLYLVELTVRMFVSSNDPAVVEPFARENLRSALSELAAADVVVTEPQELTREERVNVPWNAQFGDGVAMTCGQVLDGVLGRARRVS